MRDGDARETELAVNNTSPRPVQALLARTRRRVERPDSTSRCSIDGITSTPIDRITRHGLTMQMDFEASDGFENPS